MFPFKFMEISFCLESFRRKLDVHMLKSRLPRLGKCQAYLSMIHCALCRLQMYKVTHSHKDRLQETTWNIQEHTGKPINLIFKCDTEDWASCNSLMRYFLLPAVNQLDCLDLELPKMFSRVLWAQPRVSEMLVRPLLSSTSRHGPSQANYSLCTVVQCSLASSTLRLI